MAEVRKSCIPDGLTVVTVLPAGADQIVMRSTFARQARNGWIVTAKPTGCQGAPVVDFVVLERRFAALDAAVFAVGETLAWPSLTIDTTLSARIFAALHLPSNCGSAPPARVDGKVTDKLNAGTRAWGVAFSGHWREEWTFALCGRTVIVPIEFVADGNGGATFHITDRAIRAGAPLTPQ